MNSLPVEPVTLDNCDREPIHIPGFIQSHGVFFTFDEYGSCCFRSRNAEAMLGPSVPALGEALAAHHFFGDGLVQAMLAEVRASEDSDVIPHAMEISGEMGAFDVIAHKTSSGIICEFEATANAVPTPASFSFKSHRSMERLKRQTTITTLLNAAVEEVRGMTGFDRVMAYRFRHDESGDVVAESVTDALDPFLGRRYPASDIPAQARRLYVINTLRLIADVKALPVAVDAAPAMTTPIDMSHAVLRSVSPIHLEYLSNMGVGASMSVSIVIGGKLWGMLACHHMTPRRVSHTVRMACDVLAQILASNLQGAIAHDLAANADLAASLRSRIVEQVLHADNILIGLSSEAAGLCEAFAAQGVAIADVGKIEVFGGLSKAAGAILLDWLGTLDSSAGKMIYGDSLEALGIPTQQDIDPWCGILALPFGSESRSWLLLLRKEQIETVLWGGKPEKNYASGPLGPRLTPRGSFELWREIVRGKSVPWGVSDLESAQKLLAELQRADAAQAFETSRARNQLLAMLGHDLRDPLQSISNTATLMDKQGGDGKISKRLQSSSTRMQRLVTQVMDMSRLHGGGLSFDFQRVNMTAVVENIIGETRAAHPGMEVMPLLQADTFSEADADRISQVLSNLLSNASHHGTPREPVLVQLSASDDSIKIEVSNVGPAIPPEQAATLFQPFKRINAKSATNRNGLGLGLFIARQVLDGHGGSLTYSYAEPYVVFTATLPKVQSGKS